MAETTDIIIGDNSDLSPEEQKKLAKKEARREYMKNYMKNRINNDPDFKAKCYERNKIRNKMRYTEDSSYRERKTSYASEYYQKIRDVYLEVQKNKNT